MKKQNGFTFIETLVGVSILLIIIIGIYGAFQLGFKIVAQSKARITATALANQKIEIAKNLPYNQVGTINGIPSGSIIETENIIRNGIEYTVKTTVGYIDDEFDGIAPDDELPNDYKIIKVNVTWPGLLGGELILITNIAPQGLETTEGGGNLLISVFDALGVIIPQANINIINTKTDPLINVNYQTNNNGQYLIAGAPSSTDAYQIVITKSGYSTDRTYGIEEIINPEKPHITVIEGKLTETSFSIDQLSSFTVQTLSPWGSDNFADSFADQSNISESADILNDQGQITLATTTYTGYLISNEIIPNNINTWNEFSWTDTEPEETDIKYQVYYLNSENWLLIPDENLSNNSIGFDSSPIDLSSLATTTYTQLKIKSDLSTNNTSTSPTLFDWNVSWITGETTPINNVSFNLQGDKTIGTDSEEDPVYKYSINHTSDSNGQVIISNLEWDSYNFTIDPAENLDLINSGQDIDLLPNTNQSINLFLDAENSLLVTLLNQETLEPIFSSQTRLYNIGLSYDQTQFTDSEGKTFFIPIEAASYNIEINIDGYENYSNIINISGDEVITINLTPIGPS
ncbi:MAG: carboxypeptidase regulatory-like domain-containing protein [Candidatus Portnoybacteria bacterium]|nr:carboxypeptidase regulatory-like domain-containing protein [Candidatus Portnoybacteria bacterium]